MSNVDLHVTADVMLRVRHLRGRFEPTARFDMPNLEDKSSYIVAIDSGEIALGMDSSTFTAGESLSTCRCISLAARASRVRSTRTESPVARNLNQTFAEILAAIETGDRAGPPDNENSLSRSLGFMFGLPLW